MPAANTPSPAAAAPQEQQQPADASQGPCDLELVLATAGHLLDQRDVCALLCTSEATAACVAHSSSGQLAVKASPKTLQQAQGLARWLGAHSSLPRSLDVELKFRQEQSADEQAAHAALCAVLPSLTGLQSLRYGLSCGRTPRAASSSIAAAIQPLTQLTMFDSGGLFDADDMQLFPISLQQVDVAFRGFRQRPRKMLQLGHLTAVTDLGLGAVNEDELFAGPDGDVLPPNLVRLRGTFRGLELLKGLPSLRHLDGLYSTDTLVGFAVCISAHPRGALCAAA